MQALWTRQPVAKGLGATSKVTLYWLRTYSSGSNSRNGGGNEAASNGQQGPSIPVRGMKDRFGEENRRFNWINATGAKWASLYGYEQISTPILEHAQVFERSLGNDTDVVGKELYSFQDKGGSQLTMRPEGTAAITRALISRGGVMELSNGTGSVVSGSDNNNKFFYHGPMFRHERPQKGRLRQFEQFGIELFGQGHATADVEVIELARRFLNELGLSSPVLEINTLGDNESRQKYKVALQAYLVEHVDQLSPDSVTRMTTNPLRVLDSKSPQDIAVLENSPILSDYLTQSSMDRFDFIQSSLNYLQIPYVVNPRLVRGLDYYQETVFEFKVQDSDLLGPQQGTVLAGGRYDGLLEKMSGSTKKTNMDNNTENNPIGCIGWAAGLERLNLLIESEKVRPEKPKVVIALMAIPDKLSKDVLSSASSASSASSQQPSELQELRSRLAKVMQYSMTVGKTLREQGLVVEYLHHSTTPGGGSGGGGGGSESQQQQQLRGSTSPHTYSSTKSPLPKLLTRAVKMKATHAILVGSEELKDQVVTLRDLGKSKQKTCTLDQAVEEFLLSC